MPPGVTPKSHNSDGQLHNEARALRYLLAEPKNSENRAGNPPAEDDARITEAETEQKIERCGSVHLGPSNRFKLSMDSLSHFIAKRRCAK